MKVSTKSANNSTKRQYIVKQTKAAINAPKALGKKARKIVSMPSDFALVLQQVLIDGKDDTTMLSESLNISRSRMAHILSSLKNKGLIRFEVSRSQDSLFVSLSRRGRNLVSEIWPESVPMAA